jgi:hypothetical protein
LKKELEKKKARREMLCVKKAGKGREGRSEKVVEARS